MKYIDILKAQKRYGNLMELLREAQTLHDVGIPSIMPKIAKIKKFLGGNWSEYDNELGLAVDDMDVRLHEAITRIKTKLDELEV